jgi:hypothetical protein
MWRGAVLCMGGDSFWLEPSGTRVDADVAEEVVARDDVIPSGDRLFIEATDQTWRSERCA